MPACPDCLGTGLCGDLVRAKSGRAIGWGSLEVCKRCGGYSRVRIRLLGKGDK